MKKKIFAIFALMFFVFSIFVYSQGSPTIQCDEPNCVNVKNEILAQVTITMPDGSTITALPPAKFDDEGNVELSCTSAGCGSFKVSGHELTGPGRYDVDDKMVIIESGGAAKLDKNFEGNIRLEKGAKALLLPSQNEISGPAELKNRVLSFEDDATGKYHNPLGRTLAIKGPGVIEKDGSLKLSAGGTFSPKDGVTITSKEVEPLRGKPGYGIEIKNDRTTGLRYTINKAEINGVPVENVLAHYDPLEGKIFMISSKTGGSFNGMILAASKVDRSGNYVEGEFTYINYDPNTKRTYLTNGKAEVPDGAEITALVDVSIDAELKVNQKGNSIIAKDGLLQMENGKYSVPPLESLTVNGNGLASGQKINLCLYDCPKDVDDVDDVEGMLINFNVQGEMFAINNGKYDLVVVPKEEVYGKDIKGMEFYVTQNSRLLFEEGVRGVEAPTIYVTSSEENPPTGKLLYIAQDGRTIASLSKNSKGRVKFIPHSSDIMVNNLNVEYDSTRRGRLRLGDFEIRKGTCLVRDCVSAPSVAGKAFATGKAGESSCSVAGSGQLRTETMTQPRQKIENEIVKLEALSAARGGDPVIETQLEDFRFVLNELSDDEEAIRLMAEIYDLGNKLEDMGPQNPRYTDPEYIRLQQELEDKKAGVAAILSLERQMKENPEGLGIEPEDIEEKSDSEKKKFIETMDSIRNPITKTEIEYDEAKRPTKVTIIDSTGNTYPIENEKLKDIAARLGAHVPTEQIGMEKTALPKETWFDNIVPMPQFGDDVYLFSYTTLKFEEKEGKLKIKSNRENKYIRIWVNREADKSKEEGYAIFDYEKTEILDMPVSYPYKITASDPY